MRKKILDVLARRVTVLIIPQTQMKPWRWQCSTAFFLFWLGLWSAMTVGAGVVAGRHVDYWITKADNQVMLTKMTRLAQEMDRARRALDQARGTDRQLRGLLTMANNRDPIEAATGVGGPTLADRLSLGQMLKGGAAGIRQADWHREIARLRQDAETRLASFQEIGWYVGNQKSLRNATPTLWPTQGRVSSDFGYRFSPMRRGESRSDSGDNGEFHAGIDIANAADTLVQATADGTVRFSGWSHGYGNMVVIDHGYGLSTLYGHTSKTLVKIGDRVMRGQVIGYMGTTGRSTGAHLHYEVWRQGRPINPWTYLKVGPGPELLGYRPRASKARS
jgi:murein DD-endopeptidase MepM/ murein hydrolase activator NlpD